MNHSEFVSAYQAGKVDVDIDRNASGFLYKSPSLIPGRYRSRQAFTRALFFMGVLGGIILFFFVEWYIALGVLLFGLYMSTRATSSAAKGVLLTALANPYFYDMVRERGVLRVQEKP